MDKVVQRNAANAEESSSAAELMKVQAEQMKASVAELGRLVSGQARGRKIQRQPNRKPPKTGHKTAEQGTHAQHPRHRENLPAGKKEIRPQDIIPLDDDDMKEF
jgi:methyl-accepting chemotaxis protein